MITVSKIKSLLNNINIIILYIKETLEHTSEHECSGGGEESIRRVCHTQGAARGLVQMVNSVFE